MKIEEVPVPQDIVDKIWKEATPYYHLIDSKSEEELKWFYNHMLRDLKPGESWMICLGAREKKLDEEERKLYFLGRSEMMRENIVRFHHVGEPYKWFSEAVYAYNMDKHGLTTKNGLPYPDKTMVVYLTLNPCSSLECVRDVKQYIEVLMDEMIDSIEKGSVEGVEDHKFKMSKVFDHFKSVHARNPSEKLLVDFDVDAKFDKETEDEVFHKLSEEIQKFYPKGSFAFVRTSGGIHIVVKHNVMKCNPGDVVTAIQNFLKNNNIESDEVIYNVRKTSDRIGNQKRASAMIPCPGTYQYGNLVYIANKWDFE